MSLKDTIQRDMVSAMKNREDLRRNTLRSVLSAVTEAETNGKSRKELDDAEIINLLKKLVKSRRESAEIYAEAGATDRAEKEIEEATIIDSYLPAQLDENAIRELVQDVIAKENLADAGPRGIGQVMKVMKSRSDVDASVASRVAREILQ